MFVEIIAPGEVVGKTPSTSGTKGIKGISGPYHWLIFVTYNVNQIVFMSHLHAFVARVHRNKETRISHRNQVSKWIRNSAYSNAAELLVFSFMRFLSLT
ncbi:hypothetical protein CEXT_112681 [Caerostris extrusa]|uniref:Uncharacterized protein n=1 Tax=Caerostris extrusa TaxID=172846 RepID=A0AAV4M6Q1_CAEEX|nr:hypothetical protein CEXT_112681 [Caerostris extrusa]